MQLLMIRRLASAMALVWLLILGVSVSLFARDADLLGAAVAAIYSSVFLFLTLLSLYITNYWASAEPTPAKNVIPGNNYVWVLTLLFFLAFFFGPAPVQPTHLPTDLAFTDLIPSVIAQPTLFVNFLHWSFYRIFILDTVFLNVYVFLGLVAAVALLAFLFSQASWQNLDTTATLLRQIKHRTRITASTIKTAQNARRQVRRKNSGTVKFRF